MNTVYMFRFHVGKGNLTLLLMVSSRFVLIRMIYMGADCIGSAFNSKGAMQCPNCRKVEKGRWLYATGSTFSFPEFSIEDWTADEDLHELSYSEMVSKTHSLTLLFLFLLVELLKPKLSILAMEILWASQIKKVLWAHYMQQVVRIYLSKSRIRFPLFISSANQR